MNLSNESNDHQSNTHLMAGIRIWAALRPGRRLRLFATFGGLFLTLLEEEEVEQDAASCCRADVVCSCGGQEIRVPSICRDVWSRASGNHVVSCAPPANMMLQHNYECIISSLLNFFC